MSEPSIPANLDEKTRRLKEFLDVGATTTLEIVGQFKTSAAVLAVPRPVTVEAADRDVLGKQLAGVDSQTRLFVSLSFPPLNASDFALLVFVNTPAATVETAVSAAGFVGAVAFFMDPAGRGHEHGATTFTLPATDAARRTSASPGFTVTLVPVPYGQRPVTPRPVAFTASLQFVRSTVKRSG